MFRACPNSTPSDLCNNVIMQCAGHRDILNILEGRRNTQKYACFAFECEIILVNMYWWSKLCDILTQEIQNKGNKIKKNVLI